MCADEEVSDGMGGYKYNEECHQVPGPPITTPSPVPPNGGIAGDCVSSQTSDGNGGIIYGCAGAQPVAAKRKPPGSQPGLGLCGDQPCGPGGGGMLGLGAGLATIVSAVPGATSSIAPLIGGSSSNQGHSQTKVDSTQITSFVPLAPPKDDTATTYNSQVFGTPQPQRERLARTLT